MVAQRQSKESIFVISTIGSDHRLKLDVMLPPDSPTGQVEIELVVRPEAVPVTPALQERYPQWHARMEAARNKLRAAGRLSTTWRAPEGTVELTEAERIQFGTMPPGTQPSEELIAEDRGEY